MVTSLTEARDCRAFPLLKVRPYKKELVDSMTRIQLTLACGNYDRTNALALGDVEPEGIELNYLRLPVEETFWRMLRHREFDVAEMSLSSYLMHRSRTDDFIAIPVFPSRCFRHSCIFIHAGSGIEQPSDLAGKRVGVPEYQMTAPLWQRALLQHEYGVPPSTIQWFQGGLEQSGREEKVQLNLPSDIVLQSISSEQTLSHMLEVGEIDALLSARAPSSFSRGSGAVRRLFPDFKKIEQEYFRKTGIFPIMHVIVLRRDIVEKYPWAGANLYKAFCQAKDRLFEQMTQTAALHVSLPWLIAELEETQRLMGPDFWPYGVAANRKTLDTATQYSYEQGLTPRKLTIEELFLASTLDAFKI
jgi:4,5-dihydroxyphthalate decarboxylase